MAREYSIKRKTADAVTLASAEMGNRPPHAPEVEEAVIGAMMVESECVYMAAEALSEKSFFDPKLRLVFRAINKLFRSRTAVDMTTVAERLREDGVLEEVGGPAKLAALTASVGSAANVEYSVRILQQKTIQRDLIEAGYGILKKAFDEFREIIAKTIEVALIPILPIYIFSIFLNMSYSGQAWHIINVFVAIIGVIFLMHIFLLVFQYCLAGMIAHRNPFRALYNMLPAYFTALGTSSSAATIPVTLKQVKKNGVSDGIGGFVVPLCATIHLSGSAMKITACAVALLLMQGGTIDIAQFAGFILMLGVMMVAAPGVPGGAIMAALGVLQSILGFTAEQQAVMIALYITMDSFGTACNVTGDGAIALVVDRIYGKRAKPDLS